MSILKRILFYFCVSCRPNRSRTVKYAFPLLFTTISLIGAALILPDDASYIRLESSKASVVQDEQFYIDVYAGAHVPVNAVNISLSYPTKSVAITGIDVGESVITIWTKDPYVEGGKVYLSGGTFRKGFLGEHLIARINAKALETGKATFSAQEIMLLAGDGSGSTVSLDDSGAESLVVQVATDNGEIASDVAFIFTTDIDGDGQVGMSDILSFMGAWSAKDLVYDFNNDKRMNFTDFGIILADSFRK